MKNLTRKTKDGFINSCILGACPEIKKESGRILIRNSQKPEVVVEFSEVEFEELKAAIVNKVF